MIKIDKGKEPESWMRHRLTPVPSMNLPTTCVMLSLMIRATYVPTACAGFPSQTKAAMRQLG